MVEANGLTRVSLGLIKGFVHSVESCFEFITVDDLCDTDTYGNISRNIKFFFGYFGTYLFGKLTSLFHAGIIADCGKFLTAPSSDNCILFGEVFFDETSVLVELLFESV